MADPRIFPVDTARLSVPSAGVDGMRVQAASMSEQMGGRNLSGNVSPTLGQIAEVLAQTGPAISTGSGLAGMARTIDYQQTARQNQAELQQRADRLNISAGQFEAAKNSLFESAAQLSGLQSIATGYEKRGAELAADQERIAVRNAEIKTQSDKLFQDLRNTRDRAQQTAIKDQLTSLRDEAVANNMQAGNNLAESQLLQSNMNNLLPKLESVTAQATADKFLAQETARQLQGEIGQFGQSAQNAMNDQQAYANFMVGAKYGGMSGDALTTLSKGFADYAVGNYAAGTLGSASSVLNFSNVLSPSIAPFSSILQAGAFSTGAAIDAGDIMAGVDRFMQMTGTAGHFDGMIRSAAAFDTSYANGDTLGMFASSLGAAGNGFDLSAQLLKQTMGWSPEGMLASSVLQIGGAGMELGGAAFFNLGATNASFETQMTAGAANAAIALASGDPFGFLDFLGDVSQTFENLASERGLNNPASPKWEQTLSQLVSEGIIERGENVVVDPASAYGYGLDNSILFRNLNYSTLNPQPLTTTQLFDGPIAPYSFPTSALPVNPIDPATEAKVFTPSYEKPWDPTDPFNLDPSKFPVDRLSPYAPTCPTQPPRSRSRGTGRPPR